MVDLWDSLEGVEKAVTFSVVYGQIWRREWDSKMRYRLDAEGARRRFCTIQLLANPVKGPYFFAR
jgi:hypothetical protein